MSRIIPFIDWEAFFRRWGLSAKPLARRGAEDTEAAGAEQTRLVVRAELENEARALLAGIERGPSPLRGVAGFFPARAFDEEVALYDTALGEAGRFAFPRGTRRLPQGRPNPCLADFILPAEQAAGRFDALGLFALSAGFFPPPLDERRALLTESLAASLAEAWSAESHRRVQDWAQELSWRAAFPKGGPARRPGGIRPAFGYPCCPDHAGKRLAFRLLEAERRCGLSLTETAMIRPAASVCGMYFLRPEAFYFTP